MLAIVLPVVSIAILVTTVMVGLTVFTCVVYRRNRGLRYVPIKTSKGAIVTKLVLYSSKEGGYEAVTVKVLNNNPVVQQLYHPSPRYEL